MATRTTGPQQVRDSYRRVMQQIGEAAARRSRKASDVIMVAITRTGTPDEIRTLAELGQSDFGEPRVQQLPQRVTSLGEFLGRKRFLNRGDEVPATEIRWHLVGPLPRPKARQIIPLCRLIHTVDNLRLAEELHSFGARKSSRDDGDGDEKPIEILLQVNASGREDQFGLMMPAVMPVAEQIDSMMHLRLRGLMVDAPPHCSSDEARAVYTRVNELFQEMRTSRYVSRHFNILSMGRSDDFEIAVEEGANIVRIGKAIFGEVET
ncbi:MAG: YggS family pyridoxal phosphate-dependent enzyme [Phycisphaeraceae bacterium]